MKFVMMMFLVLAASAQAAPLPQFNAAKFRSQFELKGELFYTNPSGKAGVERDQSWRVWEPREGEGRVLVEANWSRELKDGLVAIHHKWELQDDGSIKVLIEQFGKVEDEKGETRFVNLLKKDELVVKDFAPISFVALSSPKDRNIVVRLSPNLKDEEEPELLSNVAVPVSGTEMMLTDNQGNVWADHVSLSGKFVSITSHRGTLYLSYYPFEGAKEIGAAAGSRMEISLDAKRVATLSSETAFLPEGVRAKVFGIFAPERKTDRFGRLHTGSHSDPSKLQKMGR